MDTGNGVLKILGREGGGAGRRGESWVGEISAILSTVKNVFLKTHTSVIFFKGTTNKHTIK